MEDGLLSLRIVRCCCFENVHTFLGVLPSNSYYIFGFPAGEGGEQDNLSSFAHFEPSISET